MDSSDSIVTRIVIRRNQSLSRQGLARFLALGAVPPIAFVALAIFGGWWPIVAFCVGVFLLFAAVLYFVMAGAREREVITVTTRHVVVESGRDRPRMRIVLDRYWSRIEPREGTHPALVLVSRGAVVEIAAALAEPERKALARRLAELVGSNAGYADAPGEPFANVNMERRG